MDGETCGVASSCSSRESCDFTGSATLPFVIPSEDEGYCRPRPRSSRILKDERGVSYARTSVRGLKRCGEALREL